MDANNFYSLDDDKKTTLVEGHFLGMGKCIRKAGGLCGDVYIFDQGESVHPRYSCVKLPKLISGHSERDIACRFLSEIEHQLKYCHRFVHWPCGFSFINNVPAAIFRYWGEDLRGFINSQNINKASILSIMAYVLSGLIHCYKRGLISHQDLKPENIFIQNVKNDFRGLPDVNVYNFPLVADFGLANAYKKSGIFDGAKPYMAPEQWNKTFLSPKTDMFALGVIFHELLTGGIHPVGIKTNDYWPTPKEGYTRKWTREKDWKKWSRKSDKELPENDLISIEEKSLIKSMISCNPEDRPTPFELRNKILSIMRIKYKEEYLQAGLLVDYFDKKSLEESLEKRWPALWEEWRGFLGEVERFSKS